ncbi:integrase catalytic domain-containing protein [Trichonephila clavipes]|nr:integrase catalytic domain-containing protein [Trichonephila clavipes]
MSKQRMGDLPKDRVILKRPFYCCGIDYAGPVSVLKYRGRGAKTTKGYIVIFVCFATKALHLELVSDYTSETFIAALKRFCSRRSTPKHIHSDNGTNFIGAKRKLGELLKHLPKITNEEKETREELYSGSRELEKERRALDGENLRRGLKKETWSEIGVESKER